MATQGHEDRYAEVKKQAQAQYESVKEMVDALNKANEESQSTPDGNYADANEDARNRIHEDALSVEVRSGWVVPGAFAFESRERARPEEYCILLCTGGPAIR